VGIRDRLRLYLGIEEYDDSELRAALEEVRAEERRILAELGKVEGRLEKLESRSEGIEGALRDLAYESTVRVRKSVGEKLDGN